MLAGNTFFACSRESSRSSPVWYMPLVLRKIPKRGYFMSLRQAGVGASPSQNFQNLSCVARQAPGRPESGNEGCVAGVRQHSGQCPLGVVYATGCEKDN